MFGLSNVSQAGLELVAAAMGVQPSNFLSVTCCGEAFSGLEFQGIKGLILVSALFLLDGGEERERKKITVGKEDFPRLCNGSQLLCVIKG
jgi:hypothetical protein